MGGDSDDRNASESLQASTLTELLDLHAERRPDEWAIRTEHGESLTYGAWRSQAEDFARRFLGAVRPGDVVALLFRDDEWLWYAPAFMATMRAGGVAFPVSSLLKDSEVRTQLTEAGARFVVTADRESVDRSLSVTATDVELPRSLPPDIAELVRTSGTTGTPKIVAVPHANRMARLKPRGTSEGSGGIFLFAMHISTGAGQTPLVGALHPSHPMKAVVMAEFEPNRACRLIERERVHILSFVPAMARSFLSAPLDRYDLSSIQAVFLGGAPVPPSLAEEMSQAFPSSVLMINYSTTEVSPAAIQTRFDPARPGAVGKPLESSEVSVRDARNQPAGPGVVGDIVMRAPQAASRWYLDDASGNLTTADGWIRTGDIGYLDADGYLFITDREKDVIISGGRKISSLEVESALLYHPSVVDASVFSLEDPSVGERVAAAIVASEAVDVKQVREFVRARVADYKVPHLWFVLDAIPRNPSGKALKKDLRERFSDRSTWGALTVSSSNVTPLQGEVHRLWKQVLDTDEFGIDDDFFGIGGTSLGAVALAGMVADVLDVEVDAASVFDYRTVREFAELIRLKQSGVPK